MKVKVLKRFKNKYSKNIHETNEVIDVSKKRYKEINSTKHGKLVEEVEEVGD